MKRLLIYLKNYIKESILGPLFKLLEATFELIVPLVVADIIKFGIGEADKQYVITRVLILVALGVVGLVCSITAQYFAAKAATGFATELRLSLFKHIQSLSFSEIDEVGTSGLITRLTSDVNSVQGCVNMVLRLFLRSPFIVFGSMIMAFTIDTKSALIFCVTIPVLTIVVFAIMLASIPLYKKVQARLDRVLKITRENIASLLGLTDEAIILTTTVFLPFSERITSFPPSTVLTSCPCSSTSTSPSFAERSISFQTSLCHISQSRTLSW